MIKNKKDPKNIKNINKKDFWYQTEVHFNNYKKEIKSKSTPATIKKVKSKRKDI